MEWRQQTSVSCSQAFTEAQRWIQEVTGKLFGCSDFRAALENGVLLCDLINKLKPGIIKRVNRLSTPIAGLDNVNVFLKACGKLGLNESQLFHSGDLQDLSTRVTLRRGESNRRLKNVLITIYWLGRKAHLDAFYSGPELNFKAFEGLLGLALSKSLEEGSGVFVKDGGYRECLHPDREEGRRMRRSYKREDSVDSVDSLDTRALRPNGEGCGSDAEAEQVFRMETSQSPVHQTKGHIPAPLLRRKQGQEETGSDSLLTRKFQIQVRPETPVQVNPGWIWSKSLSDIPMVYPVCKLPKQNTIHDGDTGIAQERKQDDGLMNSAATKDSDAQWQDDLTKWKIRRRSTKTDRRRKSLDREHVITQMANGALSRSEKNDTHTGRSLKREQPSPRRNRRALLSRSYAAEAPFTSTATIIPHNSANTLRSSVGVMPAADGKSFGEETQVPSLASDGAGATTPTGNFPFSSRTQVRAQCSGPLPPQPTSGPTLLQNIPTNQISTLVTTLQPKEATKPATTHKDLPVNQTSVEDGGGPDAAGAYSYLSRPAPWCGSASLPRGYRRSEGSTRLSAAITARPFGAKPSRMSSLPRICNVGNHASQMNREKESTASAPSKSSLKRQTAATHLKSEHHISLKAKKSNQVEQNGAEQVEGMGSSIPTKTNGFHHQPCTQTQTLPSQPHTAPQAQHYNSSSPQTSTKVDYSNMRVSITLKPNSVADFGFQTHWDSKGARIKFIQPGSPAELCQLCVDDEIVAVDGVAVAHLSYNQWTDKMTSALQTGRLSMDLRRYGNKDWSSGERSHLTQSRMTLNLTAAAPVLIGCPDHHANGTASTEAAALTFNEHTGNVKAGKVTDGGFAGSHRTAASKAHNSIIRMNQKRRAEFFREKGGSESAISDLQVPSLSPSSSSWSWDHEEDRRRQEKWQEEQERLLQEQYQRDQERLEAEWRRAQQDAMGDLSRKSGTRLQMTNGREGVSSTWMPVRAPTKRTTEEEPSLNGDEPKESERKTQPDAEQSDTITGQDWAVESCGFARLSPAHRAKSLSTSALAGSQKQTRGAGDQRKRKGQSQSKAELERQRILEEMKKRTQLLTDNSWIRQRSSSFYKEPVYTGAPLKRYESLDNLDCLRQSPVSASIFSFPRPHSAAGYCAPSRNSSSRYSTGSIGSRKYAAVDTAHRGSEWPGTDISEELKQELSLGPETGGPAEISAVHKTSTLVAPPSDQRAVLQNTE